ncbi:MAG: hypothetical protein ACLFNQ_12830 [Spirochaetaceae bacterium]
MIVSGRKPVMVLSVLLAVAVVLPTAADTVLVHVHGNTEALSRDDAALQITTAFEDGLMTPLFEHGHIVFNLMDDGEPLDVDTARTVGDAEGVDWVILVEIELASDNGSTRAERVRYNVVSVSGDLASRDGSFVRTQLDPRRGESRMAAVERVGRELADSVLNEI